ncbi:MAG: carbohydrate kinase family protein [Bacteroidota bacterium]
MKKIFIIGGTTFDHIISLEDFPKATPQTIHQADFNETVGSTGSGKSLCLTKLGLPNTLYSVLGDDSYGQKIIDFLENQKVDFIYDYDEKGTERHVNIMNADGQRISIFVTQSSEHPKISLNKIKAKITNSDVIVLNIVAYCKNLIPLVSKSNKPIWTDLHDYTYGNSYHEPFIEVADYIFLSSDNLPDYRKTMSEFLERGKKLIVCTHGKNGSTSLDSTGKFIDIPALTSYELKDSNGAGDNYFSGFLYAFINIRLLRNVCNMELFAVRNVLPQSNWLAKN